MNKYKIIAVLIVLLIVGVYFANNFKTAPSETVFDGRNSSFLINGVNVTLKDGVSVTEIEPGSASKITTRYFGNEVKHDLDGDGTEDIAFLVTQETGGTGLFYYVVALLNATSGPIGSQGLLLGDRIAPQTTEIDESDGKVNVIVVNYAERKSGEPMTTQPSVGKSIWLKLDSKTMQFGEVVQNFEGDADPARMTLEMKTWVWINTQYSDDKLVIPKIPDKFAITFKNDKTFSVTTDCNIVGGEYSINENKITFSKIMSTLMYCENSQESDFIKMIEQTQSYMFTSKGEMILFLKYDSGSVVFK